MGDLYTTGQAIVTNPLYSYGLQRVPAMQQFDQMDATFFSTATQTTGLVYEPFTHTIFLQPTPLQVPTLLANWVFPPTTNGGAVDTSGKWRQAVDPHNGLPIIENPDATANRYCVATTAADLPASPCFFLNIRRGEAVPEVNRAPDTYYTSVFIADGVQGGLRIDLPYGSPPILSLLTDFQTDGTPIYTEVDRCDDEIPNCGDYLAGRGDSSFRLRVICIPSEGAVVIGIGNGDATLAARLNGLTVPAGPLSVSGANGVTGIGFLPIRYVPLGSLISAPRDNGVSIVNDPCPSTDSDSDANSTVTVEVAIIQGSLYQYALTLDATGDVDSSGLATSSPLVRSVTIRFPGQSYNDWVTGYAELDMCRVQERTVFDLDSLTLSSQVDITVNNFCGQWTGASGYRAVSLMGGFNGDNWQRLTGWIAGIEASRNDPTREMTFRCFGKEHWLMRKPIGIAPPFDGWDIYGVMRWLCQRGGIEDYWLQALPYAPPGRGADTPYYHLPVGTGSQGARFQFDPQTRIWDVMKQLAKYVRGFLGFDVNGFFQFYPWSPNFFGGYMQAFDVVPDFFDDGEALLNQLKNTFTTTVDLSDVRSDVVIGGIDPFTWLPLIANRHNESVITDTTNPAFLGNAMEEIEIAPQFFDPYLQNLAADTLIAQGSLPGLSVGLNGFYQRQLMPLDIITVSEGYCLGGIYPFYILAHGANWGVNRQAHFGDSTITGRWLCNG